MIVSRMWLPLVSMDYRSWLWFTLGKVHLHRKARMPCIPSAYWIAIRWFILKLVNTVLVNILESLNYLIFHHWSISKSEFWNLYLPVFPHATYTFTVRTSFVVIMSRSSQTQDPDFGGWCIWEVKSNSDGEYGIMIPIKVDLPELVSIDLGSGAFGDTSNLTMRSSNSNLVLN